MPGFLIGIVSGAIVGGLASYAKNPLSGQPLRKDVKETVDNFTDSCHRVKTIYNELEDKNKKDDKKESKAKVFVDAFTAASFKALDHKKFFAAIKDKMDGKDPSKDLEEAEGEKVEPTKVESNVDSASGASQEEHHESSEPQESSSQTDSSSGASEHEEHKE